MKNTQKPSFSQAAELLAKAYYRCHILYEKPNKELDFKQFTSVTASTKERKSKGERHE